MRHTSPFSIVYIVWFYGLTTYFDYCFFVSAFAKAKHKKASNNKIRGF
ncbi:hypothetical protein [Nonlabens xylanidelens]|nr:hypothetical protein [Nonlabens xylanidelens]